jgi:hypothetical protein
MVDALIVMVIIRALSTAVGRWSLGVSAAVALHTGTLQGRPAPSPSPFVALWPFAGRFTDLPTVLLPVLTFRMRPAQHPPESYRIMMALEPRTFVVLSFRLILNHLAQMLQRWGRPHLASLRYRRSLHSSNR